MPKDMEENCDDDEEESSPDSAGNEIFTVCRNEVCKWRENVSFFYLTFLIDENKHVLRFYTVINI